jgi:hypothetical protein
LKISNYFKFLQKILKPEKQFNRRKSKKTKKIAQKMIGEKKLRVKERNEKLNENDIDGIKKE